MLEQQDLRQRAENRFQPVDQGHGDDRVHSVIVEARTHIQFGAIEAGFLGQKIKEVGLQPGPLVLRHRYRGRRCLPGFRCRRRQRGCAARKRHGDQNLRMADAEGSVERRQAVIG